MVTSYRHTAAAAALAIALVQAPGHASAQSAPSSPEATAQPETTGDDIVVTGTRIVVPGLTASSPISSTSEQQIKLQSAQTIEDFSTKIPQLSGGVRQGSQGSDAFGAQVLELRNFGQSRSLVLIDGTRAAPFSFRNSVDVNAIPASLIKRVDVLTGGAAAVYGADAVAG
ncbi:MAG: TonB-dependent receptor plug domain-containing protein, partial [Sphingomonas sp.]